MEPSDASINAFIEKWRQSAGAEIANSQSFLIELCGLIGVEPPDPTVAQEDDNTYVFEKAITVDDGAGHTSTLRADLYKSAHFVLESKQGTEREEVAAETLSSRPVGKRRKGHAERGTPGWDRVMKKALQQARRYAVHRPPADDWPPILMVCDVGYCLDVYAEFTTSGRQYLPFPDPRSFRIKLDDLRDPEVRQRLRLIWTDPAALDPTRRAAEVTTALAKKLSTLAKQLEADGHPAEEVAQFLMRCLFTMFAEDVGLFGLDSQTGKPTEPFTDLLRSLVDDPDSFTSLAEELWRTMDTGGRSVAIRQIVRQFNGAFFTDQTALPLTADQLGLLVDAAEAKWEHVEPAIFGTLLERALSPSERHKLGAHYTPRAYVERLVEPTIMQPLRQDWDAVDAAASDLFEQAESLDDAKKRAKLKTEAADLVRGFHDELCRLRVLDPACGSANFLYVSLELIKRLEGDVVRRLSELGGELPLVTVSPANFLGIEINPRAAAIAELVLWIGYLQWHFRSRGREALNDPVLHAYGNIECRDAVLAYDDRIPKLDADGQPVTHWDGVTTKTHPVTGEQVPDDTARLPEYEYVNPRKAEWPEADFIVGNPPFIGNKRMREALGDGYTLTLRHIYGGIDSADYVVFWWIRCAELLIDSSVKSFGLITTNSISLSFNRRHTAPYFANCNFSLAFAIPDHPWVDAEDGAAVRVAFTVSSRNDDVGLLESISDERSLDSLPLTEKTYGHINSNYTVGADVTKAHSLHANAHLSGQGVWLVDKKKGFYVEETFSDAINPVTEKPVVRKYVAAREIRDGLVPRHVIDFFGLSESEARTVCPKGFQRVATYVKPDRDTNSRESIRKLWWRFAWERPDIREAQASLTRYAVTLKSSKFRYYVFVDSNYVWDGSLYAIATDDAAVTGTLSSSLGVLWSERSGGRIGVGNNLTYTNTSCFETFPFPITTPEQTARIRELGEQLDAHRKRQQQRHDDLTMTGMYNVLEALREGRELTPKERGIHEAGLVSVLREIHDALDVAVFEAYGWGDLLQGRADASAVDEEELLQRLVDLNAERAAEEKAGLIRYLRPEFQDPDYDPAAAQKQGELIDTDAPAVPAASEKRKWPAELPDQLRAVREVLQQAPQPLGPKQVKAAFKGGTQKRIGEVLGVLEAVGQARLVTGSRFVA